MVGNCAEIPSPYSSLASIYLVSFAIFAVILPVHISHCNIVHVVRHKEGCRTNRVETVFDQRSIPFICFPPRRASQGDEKYGS